MTEQRIPGVDAAAMETGAANPGITPAVDLSFLSRAEQDGSEGLWLLTHGDHRWQINNSSLANYSHFANIHGTSTGLLDIIRERIGTSGDSVGLELAAGSSAQATRDLLDGRILSKALVTNYQRLKPRSVRRNPRLTQVKGNLTRPRPWEKVVKWKEEHAPEGFDVIMHRPVGALQNEAFPFYRGAAHALLNMLKPGRGLMFTQVPRRLVNVTTALEETCEEIRGRSDIEEIITSEEPRAPRMRKDASDLYAVILKK